MYNNVLDYLNRFKKIEKKLRMVERQLIIKKRNYENALIGLGLWIESLEEEMSSLEDVKIPLNLGELIREISNLSGIDTDKINVKLGLSNWFPCDIDSDNIMKLISSEIEKYYMVISCNGKNVNDEETFDYYMNLPLDLFFESKDLCLRDINVNDKKYTEVVIDKHIDDINLNIDLGNLVKSDSFRWYPASLFTNAVLNCLNNKKNKVRRKIK